MDFDEFKREKVQILKRLPFFIALLHGRTPKKTAVLMKCEPMDIISHVETYLFSILNIADAFRNRPNIDMEDYKKRREQFLRAAGLDEYADKTNLNVVQAAVKAVDLTRFVSMN